MTEVLLDGPGAGMTIDEYEAMRELDCHVAERLGWIDDLGHGAHWRLPGQAWRSLRDEPEGVPFYSSDMNGAFIVLCHALKVWRYSARQIFFNELQKLASFDGKGTVTWPDAFSGIIDDMPLNICKAFLNACMWMDEHNFDPINASEPSILYAEKVTFSTETYEDEYGNVRTRKIAEKPAGEAPWVHQRYS